MVLVSQVTWITAACRKVRWARHVGFRGIGIHRNLRDKLTAAVIACLALLEALDVPFLTRLAIRRGPRWREQSAETIVVSMPRQRRAVDNKSARCTPS